MRGMKLARAMENIDEEYICEAAPERVITVKTFPWKYVAIASSIALVFCIGFMAIAFGARNIDSYGTAIDSDSDSESIADSSSRSETKWEKITVKNDSSFTDDIAKEKNWSEMTLSERYSEFKYRFAEGAVNKYSSCNAKIPTSEIRTYIGNTFISSVRNNGKNLAYAEMYTIDGISKDKAIAVNLVGEDNINDYTVRKLEEQYAGNYIKIHESGVFSDKQSKEYYVYINDDFKPKTLYEFALELKLENNVSFKSAYYTTLDSKTIMFDSIDKKKVWDILFSDGTKSVAVDNPDEFITKQGYTPRISISTDVPIFGEKGISVSVSDNGYLFTNIFRTAKLFNIGKEKVAQLQDYLTSSCKGYELVYESNNSTSNTDDSSKVVSDSDSSASSTSIYNVDLPDYEEFDSKYGKYIKSNLTLKESDVDTTQKTYPDAIYVENSDFGQVIRGKVAEVYSIKDTKPEQALAVRANDDSSKYYLFFNKKTAGNSFYDLFREYYGGEIDIVITQAKKLESGKETYQYKEYTSSVICDILGLSYNDTDREKNYYTWDLKNSVLFSKYFNGTDNSSFSVMLEMKAGSDNKKIEMFIAQNGYIKVIMNDDYYIFYFGDERITVLLDYLETFKK